MFDTSALIDYLKGRNRDAISHVEAVISGSTTGSCPTICEAELWTGVRAQDKGEQLRVAALISKFVSIPFTSTAARTAGGLLNRMDRAQAKANFGDALVAASAIEVGETILTADAKSERVFGPRAKYEVYR